MRRTSSSRAAGSRLRGERARSHPSDGSAPVVEGVGEGTGSAAILRERGRIAAALVPWRRPASERVRGVNTAKFSGAGSPPRPHHRACCYLPIVTLRRATLPPGATTLTL